MEEKNDNLDKTKATHDPGWNDPPLFTYDATQSANQQKRTTPLNKRVAFPLGTKPTTNFPPIDPTLPPKLPNHFTPPPPYVAICPPKPSDIQIDDKPPSYDPVRDPTLPPKLPSHFTPPPPYAAVCPYNLSDVPNANNHIIMEPTNFPLLGNALSECNEPEVTATCSIAQPDNQPPNSNLPTEVLDKHEALETVMENINGIMNTAAESFKKNGEEIRRRLEIMNNMWEEDKLKPDVHNKMLQLSNALKDGDGDAADRIHVGLMVDHVALCSPWMVGVRQLIHHVKSTSPQDNS